MSSDNKYTVDFLKEAHRLSTIHRIDVLSSQSCGCFYCGSVFLSTEITEWVDEDENGVGQTALCPKCGIDSVLAENSNSPILDKVFLDQMRKHYF